MSIGKPIHTIQYMLSCPRETQKASLHGIKIRLEGGSIVQRGWMMTEGRLIQLKGQHRWREELEEYCGSSKMVKGAMRKDRTSLKMARERQRKAKKLGENLEETWRSSQVVDGA